MSYWAESKYGRDHKGRAIDTIFSFFIKKEKDFLYYPSRIGNSMFQRLYLKQFIFIIFTSLKFEKWNRKVREFLK